MKIIAIILLALTATQLQAKGFKDKSDLGTPEMAECAAAALKTNLQRWNKWHDALHERYKILKKDKMTAKEIESYTTERVMDKKKGLERGGYKTRKAFEKYFKINCEGELEERKK